MSAERTVAIPRMVGLALTLLAATLTMLLAGPAPAHAAIDPTLEAEFVDLVNQERAAVGLHPLTVATDIVTVARAHSVVMADRLDNDITPALHHNPDYSTQITGWQIVAENVGRGPSVTAIHTALMNSEGHRRNILEPRLTEIGVGVEHRHGRVWVTQNFRRPRGAVTPAAPTPTPQPEPDPAPTPAPAPPPTPIGTFSDVAPDSTHAPGIEHVTTTGIATGCTSTRFCPNDAVTRGAFAGMLARALDLQPAEPTTFTDTHGETAGYIQALYDAGVTTGLTADTFAPDRQLTREQLSSFFARALGLTPRPSPFPDTSAVHDPNVGALHARGIVQGYSPTRFGATEPITRAQTATMLTREFR